MDEYLQQLSLLKPGDEFIAKSDPSGPIWMLTDKTGIIFTCVVVNDVMKDEKPDEEYVSVKGAIMQFANNARVWKVKPTEKPLGYYDYEVVPPQS